MCQKMLCDLCFKTALRVKLRCYTPTPEDTRPKKSVQTTNSIVHTYKTNRHSASNQRGVPLSCVTKLFLQFRYQCIKIPFQGHVTTYSTYIFESYITNLEKVVIIYLLLMQCILLNFKR